MVNENEKFCDWKYSWNDVKEAVNNCLLKIYRVSTNSTENLVKEIFQNGLPRAMDTVAIHQFSNDNVEFDDKDIKIIKYAYKQLNEVGYIGNIYCE